MTYICGKHLNSGSETLEHGIQSINGRPATQMEDIQVQELRIKIAGAQTLQEMLAHATQLRDRIRVLLQDVSNLNAPTQDVFETHIC